MCFTAGRASLMTASLFLDSFSRAAVMPRSSLPRKPVSMRRVRFCGTPHLAACILCMDT